MTDPTFQLAINHIGLAVPDILAAIDWYQSALGFRLLSGPVDIGIDGSAGPQAQNVLGPKFRSIRMAHLTSANGVGLELFQSIDPPHRQNPSDEVLFWQGGVFHFCLTTADLDATVSRITSMGGRQLSQTWCERPDIEGRMCYCADPFGNILELYTCSYEIMQSQRQPTNDPKEPQDL